MGPKGMDSVIDRRNKNGYGGHGCGRNRGDHYQGGRGYDRGNDYGHRYDNYDDGWDDLPRSGDNCQVQQAGRGDQNDNGNNAPTEQAQ